MNQWGAVKLGLVVAAAGAMGALRFARTPSQTPSSQAPVVRAALPESPKLVGAQKGGGLADIISNYAGGTLSAAPEAAPAEYPKEQPAASPSPSVKKIVKTATVVLEVADEGKAQALVRGAALKLGAEIDSEETAADGEIRSSVVVIKVAPEKLDALLKALEPAGRVLQRAVASENMSEEYVDLKARLDNARKVEKRLTELLAFKTRRLADVLEVERELERVGRDIEQTIGRMKYIDTLAANSCVTVRLQEPRREPSQAAGAGREMRNSLTKTLNTFVETGLSLLNLTGFLLAVGLWTAPVAAGLWLLKGRLGR